MGEQRCRPFAFLRRQLEHRVLHQRRQIRRVRWLLKKDDQDGGVQELSPFRRRCLNDGCASKLVSEGELGARPVEEAGCHCGLGRPLRSAERIQHVEQQLRLDSGADRRGHFQ